MVLFEAGERSAAQYVVQHQHAVAKALGEEEDAAGGHYAGVTQSFYDIATSFYMWGWGRSFHFAPRNAGEPFGASILRHEHWLAGQLDVRPGQRVMDLGCGVCGPLVNISKFTRAEVTGVTIDEFQVGIGSKWIAANGLASRCRVVHGDFHALPFEANSFEAGYDMEASAHSTKLSTLFAEINRCLTPGGTFCGMAWVTTPSYDASNAEHKRLVDGVAFGNGISVVHSFQDYKDAVAKVKGLELVCDYDMALLGDDLPWYDPLLPKMTLEGVLSTRAGRLLTSSLAWFMERVGLAPAGAYLTATVLEEAAVCLVKAGQLNIYTPMHFYKVRKVA